MQFQNLQSRKEEPMTEYSYTVLFEPAEEGGYVAFCPALPGLVTEGDTYEEAHERVTEAMEGYLESLLKNGEPIPPDKKIPLEPVKEQIRIALPEHTCLLSSPPQFFGLCREQVLVVAQLLVMRN
jgi:antitoxin HicB